MTVSFSESQVKPGSNISINLQAAPGSRFALSAVDRSVQLLGSSSDLKSSQVIWTIIINFGNCNVVNSLTTFANQFVEMWLSGLSAWSGTREVPGSSPVNSHSCEDNFSQLNP